MPDTIRVDFNKPTIAGNELEYMQQAITAAKISGDGSFTEKCNQLLEEISGAKKVLITTNCTHALEMTALLLHIQPGDEVIIPSFTFVSTVNAFVLRGARPVFIDMRADTLNLDETQLEKLITPRTKCVVPVHYAGVGCEMDTILSIANKAGIPVVEDNAHGLFGRYKGKPLGSFGMMATQSFHETKNITCGEGGALLINDPALVEEAEIIREKGTNRSRFFRGMVDKYTWVLPGSSYLPSEMLAAFLYGQLERWETIQKKRMHIWDRYWERLHGWIEDYGVRLPVVPPECEHPAHMFYLLLPDLETRQNLITYLKTRGIYTVFHYLPLHLSEMGVKYGGKAGDCPVTEKISDQLVRLPLHTGISDNDIELVVDGIRDFLRQP
jgi:dTDP-4-amino-4,6-dideoxygalactose transaminase